jgi:uncharacterized membrane protein YkoI
MKTPNLLLAAAAAVALTAPASAQVQRPKLTLADAVTTAEQQFSARAYDAEFDVDLGDMVYEVSLVKNGRPMEVLIDANTGKVVRQSKSIRPRLPIVGDHLKAAQTAPRSLSDTIAMVEQATKGKVAEIGLERRGGRHYYEVELVGAQDREVLVDVRTGAITPLIGD